MASFVLDTFQDAGGTTLAAHHGEIGATWASVAGTPADLATYVLNGANQLASPNNGNPVFASGAPTSPDYFVEIELVPTFFYLPYIWVNVYLRIASPGGGHTQYIVRYDFYQSTLSFGTDTSAFTPIPASTIFLNNGSPSVLRVEAQGTTLTAMLRDTTGTDQVPPLSVTVSLYSAAGKAGFASSASAGCTALINRFEAGPLGAPPPQPAFWSYLVGSYEVP